MAFKDGGKITLQADTVFAIEDINIEKGKAGSGNAFFRLLKGGVRALTGLIGGKNPGAYRIKTPVATMGIRGTGFDLRCQGSCVSQVVSSEDLSGLPLVDGLFVSVWEGSITITQDSGEYVLNEEKVVFIPNAETEPVSLDELPGFMLENPAPRPDKVPLDNEVYFGTINLIDWPPGLYVDVEEGHITIVQNDTGDELELADHEAAYASYDDKIMVRLEWRPPFLLDDPYLDTINESFLPLYELLNDTTDMDEFECKIF